MVQQVKQDQEEEKTASLKQGGIYHFRNLDGVFKTAVIFPLHKGMVGLSKALRVFEDEGLNLVHIESRKVKGSKDKTELYLEIDSEESDDWNKIQHVIDTLRGVDLCPTDSVPTWRSMSVDLGDCVPFPKAVADLDACQKVLVYGTDLDADHPGFKDPVYRKRRDFFGGLAMIFRHGQQLPRVKYTEEEIGTWSQIFSKLKVLHLRYACKQFLDNWGDLERYCGYREDNIPQLEDINRYLRSKTGFQIRPVAGYLSPRDFLAGLAFRVFHCTQYIRHSSDPFYTPEPDCCHELLGHMPLFADSSFAQFSQEIGLASLGSNEFDLKKLATCYFFTVEFGLCIEKNEFKIYGAGLLSSAAEMKHVIDGIRNNSICLHKFDVGVAAKTPCIVTDFQKRYFYTKDIEEAKNEMKKLASSVERDGILRYNPYTQSIECIP